ncbi:PQQ-binding-like beta-propeller repeat protein [Anaeromyxobacter oryzae]|uniref:Pyrrolo-quinoline quinone n=1 Tax=Anaeromyxobacter oryzae TaxID=2918170 RepID=A0ABM7WYZ5_9BACT|nr:hypothetical protein [Anaeromyxobacter oryzae]BDG04718.1 hypothetical protein AMOR_37140 [Anaeromyxobacter oryzae]
MPAARFLGMCLLVLLSACRADRRATSWTPDPHLTEPVAPTAALPEPLRTADGTLATAWTYAVPAGREAIFPGAAGADGSVYWLEIADAATGAGEVVAFRADGSERWRVPIPAGSARSAAGTPEETLLVAGDFLVLRTGAAPVACATDARVVALRTADGAVAWSHAFAADLAEPRAFWSCSATASAPAASGSAAVLVVTRCAQQGRCAHAVEAYALAGGGLRWSASVPDAPAWTFGLGPLLDERGDAYVLGGDERGRRLVSVSPAGKVRYDVPAPARASALVAVASGVVIAPPAILDAATGAEIGSLAGSASAAVAGRSAYAVVDAFAEGETAERLERVRLGTSTPSWAVDVGRIPTAGVGTWTLAPLPTEAGTLLVGSTDWETGHVSTRTSARLREIDVDGLEWMRVALPDRGRDRYESAVLADGRWVALVGVGWEPFGEPAAVHEIRAFELPGRRPLAWGWSGAHGSAGADRRAR